MAVPNIYLYENGKCYDASILINRDGPDSRDSEDGSCDSRGLNFTNSRLQVFQYKKTIVFLSCFFPHFRVKQLTVGIIIINDYFDNCPDILI